MQAFAHPGSTAATLAADCAVPADFGTTAERLALILLNLAERFEAEAGFTIHLTPALSVEELAGLSGGAPDTATLLIRHFLAEGIIAQRRQRFILCAPERLQLLALGAVI